jgi:hypothetical protein
MSVTFEEIVRAWLLEYDDRLPMDRRERQEAFVELLGNLKDYGYGKEELSNSKKEKIIKSSVNPNYRHKNKLKIWIDMAVKDLEAAILVFYKNVPIKKGYVTPEIAAKLDNLQNKAAESKALASNSSEDAPDENFSIEDNTKLDMPTPPSKNDGGVIETTDEMLDQMDGPEAVWDNDLIKELGIKIYE